MSRAIKFGMTAALGAQSGAALHFKKAEKRVRSTTAAPHHPERNLSATTRAATARTREPAQPVPETPKKAKKPKLEGQKEPIPAAAEVGAKADEKAEAEQFLHFLGELEKVKKQDNEIEDTQLAEIKVQAVKLLKEKIKSQGHGVDNGMIKVLPYAVKSAKHLHDAVEQDCAIKNMGSGAFGSVFSLRHGVPNKVFKVSNPNSENCDKDTSWEEAGNAWYMESTQKAENYRLKAYEIIVVPLLRDGKIPTGPMTQKDFTFVVVYERAYITLEDEVLSWNANDIAGDDYEGPEDAIVMKEMYELFHGELADMVDGIQTAGLYHNDIKGNNIMKKRDGTWILIDIGSFSPDKSFNGFSAQGNANECHMTLVGTWNNLCNEFSFWRYEIPDAVPNDLDISGFRELLDEAMRRGLRDPTFGCADK